MNGKTCDVYVKLPHGIIIGQEAFAIAGAAGIAMDSARTVLEHGFNENVPRAEVEAWLTTNKHLAAVRRGDVRIIDGDRLAVDSSNRK